MQQASDGYHTAGDIDSEVAFCSGNNFGRVHIVFLQTAVLVRCATHQPVIPGNLQLAHNKVKAAKPDALLQISARLVVFRASDRFFRVL